MDRLYIDTRKLGAEISYYKSGNISGAKWRGEDISNSDGRRLLLSKVYVDIADGSLHVSSTFDKDSVRRAAEEFVDSALSHSDGDSSSEPSPIDSARTLDEAYDQLALDLVAHRGDRGHNLATIDQVEKRFGVDYIDIEHAMEPRLRKLVTG